MESLIKILKENFSIAIENAFEGEEILSSKEKKAEISFCIDQSFGNYQCNNALKIAKILKKNPREIAQLILKHLDKDKKSYLIEKIDIAGPGFINIFISKKYLSSLLEKIFLDPFLGVDIPKERKKIIVEFSSPNVAKQLHVGHLRSTIIGDCIARLFEFLQYDVLRLNHIGDFGTQFGMLIAYLKRYEKEVLLGEKRIDLLTLENLYKKSKEKFDNDEEFKKESQEEVVLLQRGEKSSFDAWKKICDISKEAYMEIYDILDINLIERGESFYSFMLKEVVEDLEKRGLITISEGAKCIYLEGFKNREGNPLPLMVQKSDGGYNYDTTDMAAMKHRIEEEKASRIIVVTDFGQSLHFKLVHNASIKAKYLDPQKVQFDHVTFGLVLGPDGKKFKTRSGQTEKLIDLIQGAIKRAKDVILQKNPEISKDEINHLANILGVDAIKYSDLSCNRNKDYQFSYDKMLKFEGNTAVFLLYSYVRAMGIKRKLKETDGIISKAKIEISHISEFNLAMHIQRFGEVIKAFEKELMPNRLAEYLYVLAEKYNAFFRDCQVIGTKEQNSRLKLSELSANVLKRGLNILGLKVTDKL